MNSLGFVLLIAACSYVNGYNVNERILNGNLAAGNQWGYIVSIQRLSALPNQLQAHICGGTLLTLSHVLTTATCVMDGSSVMNADDLRVFAGNNTLIGDDVNDRIRTIATITIAPDFSAAPYFNNDLAIIKLSSPYSNTVVSTLTLNKDVTFAENDECYFPGWGSIVSGSTEASNELRYVNKYITNHTQCTEMYLNISSINRVTHDMICAYSPNSATCNGDNGSPLICNGNLAGLLILNTECVVSSLPDVYIQIPIFYDWINEVTSSAFKSEISVLSIILVSLTTLFLK